LPSLADFRRSLLRIIALLEWREREKTASSEIA
jgi:hypothetical protein